jgi:hypothetical protein
MCYLVEPTSQCKSDTQNRLKKNTLRDSGASKKKCGDASAGNRTRGLRMASGDFTTKPLMLLLNFRWRNLQNIRVNYLDCVWPRLVRMDFLEDDIDGKENFLNEDVVELQRVWRNELNSVEILPFQLQLVEEISQLLFQQQVK